MYNCIFLFNYFLVKHHHRLTFIQLVLCSKQNSFQQAYGRAIKVQKLA